VGTRAAYYGTKPIGATVADLGALTSATPSAITAANAAGGTPTAAEHNALVVDVTALRATLAAAVNYLATERTKINALLASLRTAKLLSP